MENTIINTNYSFTEDSSLSVPFWKDFWDENEICGASTSDPDKESEMLEKYHKILWGNRILPNGKTMILEESLFKGELNWADGGITFTSDWFVNTYLHWQRCYTIFEELSKQIPNYKKFMKDFTQKTYTIGGSIIFPKNKNGINQARGKNFFVSDRCDLTLECIKRFYEGKNSPLSEVLNQNSEFFKLFEDFKGYIDYFYLNDLVSEDYNSVKIAFGCGDFSDVGYPQKVEDWLLWHDKMCEFIDKRNKRIESAQIKLCH